MNDRRVQLGCCYCSYAFIALFCLGWMVLARFLPPPSPTASAETIANQFRGNATGIRLGMIVSIVASTLLLPWGGAVCVQLRRIDVGGGALVWAWSAALALLVLEFIYPCAFWCVAAFRLEDAERIQSFNDLAWLPFFSIVSTGIFQMIVLAIMTFADKRAEPVFPRWFAYFQIWCAFGVAPASFVVVFKTGPFAWERAACLLGRAGRSVGVGARHQRDDRARDPTRPATLRRAPRRWLARRASGHPRSNTGRTARRPASFTVKARSEPARQLAG